MKRPVEIIANWLITHDVCCDSNFDFNVYVLC